MMRTAVSQPVVIFNPDRMRQVQRSVAKRHRVERGFRWLCCAIASSSVLLLCVFLGAILYQGLPTLSLDFLTHPPSPDARDAGFHPAILGTVWLLVLVAFFSLPLGVATAILLEEFQPRQTLCRRILDFVQANITNLAGVPSVVYGIVGMTAFVSMFQMS